MRAIVSRGFGVVLALLLAALLTAASAAAAPCDLLGGDGDGDGVCDDGSGSGAVGDAPCSCPPAAPPECVAACDDNCPWEPNPDQLDVGRVGDPDLPDGVGDLCQCADVTADGRGNLLDAVLYRRVTGGLLPELAAPRRCLGTGASTCDASDVPALRAALASPVPPLENVCLAAGACSASADCPPGIACDLAAQRCEKNDGQACAEAAQCLSESCCADVCTDVSSDAANCGACGFACTNAHGTTSCVAGGCAPTCAGLWGDCDGHPEDGCDTSLETLSNCGACGVDCGPIPNSAETCAGGSCGILYCNGGWANCNAELGDGCETSLNDCASTGCCSSSPLGSFAGDGASCGAVATRSARGETCFTATFREDGDGCAPTAGMIELTSPPGANYNLYLTVPAGVTCQRWTGSFWTSGCASVVGGGGGLDRVRFVNAESCPLPGVGDTTSQTFSVTAEVRYSNSDDESCGDWQLGASAGSGC